MFDGRYYDFAPTLCYVREGIAHVSISQLLYQRLDSWIFRTCLFSLLNYWFPTRDVFLDSEVARPFFFYLPRIWMVQQIKFEKQLSLFMWLYFGCFQFLFPCNHQYSFKPLVYAICTICYSLICFSSDQHKYWTTRGRTYVPVCLFVCLSLCFCVYICICLTLCLSVYLHI